MKIYLTAIIRSKPEHTVEVVQVLENMVIQTTKEPACIQYDLHRSILQDENLFVFYEIWESQQALDLHNEQSYIKDFGQLADEKLQEKPEIYLTRKIEK
ncbi:putative quinol monooxygenase [Chitinophaga sancti]|uniref:Quinol monooxygenase n=1 Tax=Chitinophaga sancti TaxID=1004 RepID=A0A1K1R4Y8_9BACT|nr:putative quinol monooxygenase [Chitinophaga sancti]WQD64228.1 putative quinol monooxygenase [Chitinophaga sancti]WQG90148.1 putative quinol monooxygenase [Chitinophaga sancti]SFW67298.1 Quinol monooxygenase YgiN [Chitinophaga sancti]